MKKNQKKKSTVDVQKKINAASNKETGLAGPLSMDAQAMDVFRNIAARMGAGTPSLAQYTEYELNRYTNDYWLMVTLFRNHWICRRIVEKPAQDMTRAWPILECDLTPEQIDDFDRTLRRLNIPKLVQKCLIWARLFGGAGALICIEGQEDILDEPLDLDSISPGSFKGLIPFDRWSGITPKGNVQTDIDSPANFDSPEFYTVHGSNGPTFEVHSSRILKFSGPSVPNPEYQASMYWGISVLEVIFEEIKKRDNTSWSILQLIFRAQIMTQVNPELAQMLSGASASAGALQRFLTVMEAQNQLMSNNSMLILGKDGKLESHAYTFSGIAEMYSEFRADLCGAAKMPEVILFGRMPGGLATGNEANMRIYEQEIAQNQEEELRPVLDKLYPVICMSEFGEVPDDLDFKFPSVRVLTEEEKAVLAKDVTESVVNVFNAGLISQKTALKELQAVSSVTGVFTNITNNLIEQADDEIEMPIEVEAGEAKAKPESGGAMDEWSESDHPRDESGKFSATSGQSTEEFFKGASGSYTPERQSLHSSIVSKLLEGKKGSANPKAFVLGGGSASGKSTGFNSMYSEKFRNEIGHIDSDKIKEMIPEYEELKKANPENAAKLVHEESSKIAKQAMAVAAANKIDFVYDSTGSGKHLSELAKNLHNEGYKVHAIYFDVPLEEARGRAALRAARTGRHIPEEVMQGTHRGSAQSFMKLKESKHIATANLFNNTDRIPALVYKKGEGESGLVVDKTKWKQYMEKANGD